MPGRTHKVMIRGEELVQACERRFGSYCGHCEAKEAAEGPKGAPVVVFRPSVGTPAGWSDVEAPEL